MAEQATSKKGCAKKRSKKDPIMAAARTAANKKRHLAVQAKRQQAKLKKTRNWGTRNGATGYTCRAIRAAVRKRLAPLASI